MPEWQTLAHATPTNVVGPTDPPSLGRASRKARQGDKQSFDLKGQNPACQFTVVDDYTRLAYALITPHRTTQAALEDMDKAHISFGFSIKMVLTDNDVTFAWTFRPNWKGPQGGITRFTKTLQSWGIHHSPTRIRRPQTNGKVGADALNFSYVPIDGFVGSDILVQGNNEEFVVLLPHRLQAIAQFICRLPKICYSRRTKQLRHVIQESVAQELLAHAVSGLSKEQIRQDPIQLASSRSQAPGP